MLRIARPAVGVALLAAALPARADEAATESVNPCSLELRLWSEAQKYACELRIGLSLPMWADVQRRREEINSGSALNVIEVVWVAVAGAGLAAPAVWLAIDQRMGESKLGFSLGWISVGMIAFSVVSLQVIAWVMSDGRDENEPWHWAEPVDYGLGSARPP